MLQETLEQAHYNREQAIQNLTAIRLKLTEIGLILPFHAIEPAARLTQTVQKYATALEQLSSLGTLLRAPTRPDRPPPGEEPILRNLSVTRLLYCRSVDSL